MKVLIACEFSGVVRNAFRELGHDAWSCDLLESSDNSKYHLKEDVLNVIHWNNWDLMIAHPPCTHLAVSGARWFKDKQDEQKEALEFVRKLLDAPIEKIALENPVSVISSQIRKPDQLIQPYQFGHEASKKTCLWLKNLPKLEPTKLVSPGEFHITKSGRKIPKWYNLPPSKDRWKKRSITFEGIAKAMAEQWGEIK